MAIRVSCECGKQYRAKVEFAGRKMKCQACGAVLVVGSGAVQPVQQPKSRQPSTVTPLTPVPANPTSDQVVLASLANAGETNPYVSPTAEAITSDPKPSEDTLATRGERFAGALVDNLIVMPLGLVAGFAVGFVLGIVLLSLGLDVENPSFDNILLAAGAFVGAVVFLTVNGYTLATRGQTLGKMLLKTKIVSNDGQQLALTSLVLKRYTPVWLLTSIPMVGPFFAFANALAIFRKNRKCLHDEIAGTKVIKIA